jgi:hypothetical protein
MRRMDTWWVAALAEIALVALVVHWLLGSRSVPDDGETRSGATPTLSPPDDARDQ